MSKIFIIMGKSSTGKDTIYQKLLRESRCNLKEIIMYTTRPIREGEVNGINYHFVEEEAVNELMNQNKIIEQRAYNTVHGIWYYFTVNDDQIDLENNNYLMHGTLESFRQIREYYGENTVIPIYIEVETGKRLQRALNRELEQLQPKYVELCRRFIADEEDFSEEKIQAAGIQRRYENDILEECILEMENAIIKILGNI